MYEWLTAPLPAVGWYNLWGYLNLLTIAGGFFGRVVNMSISPAPLWLRLCILFGSMAVGGYLGVYFALV